MGSAKSKQGYRLNREDLEFLKASVPTVVELMNQNHTSQKEMFLRYIVIENHYNLIFWTQNDLFSRKSRRTIFLTDLFLIHFDA